MKYKCSLLLLNILNLYGNTKKQHKLVCISIFFFVFEVSFLYLKFLFCIWSFFFVFEVSFFVFKVSFKQFIFSFSLGIEKKYIYMLNIVWVICTIISGKKINQLTVMDML